MKLMWLHMSTKQGSKRPPARSTTSIFPSLRCPAVPGVCTCTSSLLAALCAWYLSSGPSWVQEQHYKGKTKLAPAADKVLVHSLVQLLMHGDHSRAQLGHCGDVPWHCAKVTCHSWKQHQVDLPAETEGDVIQAG